MNCAYVTVVMGTYQLNSVCPLVDDPVCAKRMAEKKFKGAPFGTQAARYFYRLKTE